mgnify:CR=1 FL=1
MSPKLTPHELGSTLGITIQTFVVLVLQWNCPKHFAKYLTLGVWAIVALIVGITTAAAGVQILGDAGQCALDPDFLSRSPHFLIHMGLLGCWITRNYRREQILSQYLWMWFITILTIVLYIIAALVILGYVKHDENGRLHWVSRDQVRLEFETADSEEQKEAKQMATQLLL